MDKKEVSKKENERKIDILKNNDKNEYSGVDNFKKEIKKHSAESKENRNSVRKSKDSKNDLKRDLKRDLKNESKNESKNELKNDLKKDSKSESKSEPKSDLKKDLKIGLKSDENKRNNSKNTEQLIREINYRNNTNEKKKDIKVSASKRDDKKKDKISNRFLVQKQSEENEGLKKSKVTDFDEVKKVAMANEKKRRKEQHIQNIKDRYEQLQTPKARICITAVLLLVGFLVFVAMTVINDIEIDEGKHYTEEQVKRMVIKNIFDYNSVYLFLKYRYSEHEEIPFVEYIDVEWIDKNTVRLKVYDKNIIGCTSFMNEYVYFDKDGYVVETSSKKEKDILYITGIEFEELALNSRIKVDDDKIFDTILTITQQISKYKLEVDELKFDKDFSMTLYSGDITVLLGKHATYDEQLAKLKSLLEEAKKENLSGVLHMEKYKEGQDRIIFDKK